MAQKPKHNKKPQNMVHSMPQNMQRIRKTMRKIPTKGGTIK